MFLAAGYMQLPDPVLLANPDLPAKFSRANKAVFHTPERNKRPLTKWYRRGPPRKPDIQPVFLLI